MHSTIGSPHRFTAHTTLPYQPTHLENQKVLKYACELHSFGGLLKPRYIVGAESLDQ